MGSEMCIRDSATPLSSAALEQAIQVDDDTGIETTCAVRWAHTNNSSSGGGRRTQRQWRAGLPRATATAAGHSVGVVTGWEWLWCSEHQ